MGSRLLFPTLAALAFGLLTTAAAARTTTKAPPALSAVDHTPPGAPCPRPTKVVDIKAANDILARFRQMVAISENVGRDHTLIRLGPGVDLDFSNFPNLPLQFGRCVTLKGVSSFSNDPPVDPTPQLARRGRAALVIGGAGGPPAIPEARSPQSRGPILRFGNHSQPKSTFIEIRCYDEGRKINDGARISGFQLRGPQLGQQDTGELGIHIIRCIDVEISNMEIAGWGGAAIKVDDHVCTTTSGDEFPCPDEPPHANGRGGRIWHSDQIKIHDNFFHHNQHPTESDCEWVGSPRGGWPGTWLRCETKAAGYGVDVGAGAWARIYRNVFDFNRHAIAAAGDSGGYSASLNLVLKGGGYHGGLFNTYTHSFDVHGTGCWWSKNLCGTAGKQFWFVANSFQYRNDNAIKIRGRPELCCAVIAENVFPHPGFEDDDGDDAVHLNTRDNVTLGPSNVIDFDSFGKYGVCDFDGDAIDDLFLSTGATWWYSSAGEFHWSYLNARTERLDLDQVRLGYFDGDKRCDVLAEQDGRWVISSGGTGDWQALGAFGAPLSEVRFGRFARDVVDTRPGATLRTTHAFRRAPDDDQWYVTPLSRPAWRPVNSSGFPLSELRFGDFTGDGVTDVLAVENGRWAISKAAAGPWRRLNRDIGSDVANVFIANMDRDDNIDDILRLDVQALPAGLTSRRARLTWWRSKNGAEPWRRWKQYEFVYPVATPPTPAVYGFAGRFGVATGGGTLTISPDRVGLFFSEAETALGRRLNWESLFSY